MEETLVNQFDPQGVGLAAPQVGVSLAFFIIKLRPTSPTEVYINPKIVKESNKSASKKQGSSKDGEEKLEGCLSIPRIWGALKRPQKVQIEYQGLDGKTHVNWVSGLKAVIVQHEIDHLKGVLFTQRSLEQNVSLYEEDGNKLKRIKAL